MFHKGKFWIGLPKRSCCKYKTLVGLHNGQVELGWKVLKLGNSSADEQNGSTQGNKDLKKFKENQLQNK
jgi:hypothetical protein